MTWSTVTASPQPDDARIAALEAAVADLQQRLAALERAAAQSEPTAAGGAVDPWSVPPWPEVVMLLRSGKKIEAIKVYREHTGVGLKEAKDTIDEVGSRLG